MHEKIKEATSLEEEKPEKSLEENAKDYLRGALPIWHKEAERCPFRLLEKMREAEKEIQELTEKDFASVEKEKLMDLIQKINEIENINEKRDYAEGQCIAGYTEQLSRILQDILFNNEAILTIGKAGMALPEGFVKIADIKAKAKFGQPDIVKEVGFYKKDRKTEEYELIKPAEVIKYEFGARW